VPTRSRSSMGMQPAARITYSASTAELTPN
jgi:hypothetical protein